MAEQSEKGAGRERVAQALADARKAWPGMDGSPVYELFAADMVLDALGLEQIGWHAEDPYRFCPMKSDLWESISNKTDYAPVYTAALTGKGAEA